MRRKEIIVQGLKTSYWQQGNQEKIPLICLPGWLTPGSVYEKALDFLSDYLILEWPGFGLSQKPPQVWGIEDYASFLREFLEKLGIKKCILLGHSFGGSVAIYFAAHNPRIVEKLILVASSGIRRRSRKERVKLFFWRWLAKLLKIFLFWLPLKVKRRWRRKMMRWLGSDDYLTEGIMREIYRRIIQKDLQAEMKRISSPTILLWGEKDDSTPLSEGRLTAQLISGAKLKIIPRAGHFPFRDNYQSWRRFLESALSECI